MENKNIDWQGTMLMVVISIALINGILFILDFVMLYTYIMYDFGTTEFHLIITIMFLLRRYQNASIVMYEGWKEDDYEDVYPPENIRNGITALIILIVLFLFIFLDFLAVFFPPGW
tara:strand:- start:481 stop:828 length:348 start_codon:yes stop_codon:yes gene_type:complete